jgi:toxin secretion/phage lysis holin
VDKFYRNGFFAMVSVLGGCLGDIFGGWDIRLNALVTCMILDYISGMVVALVFKNSTKTETGGAQSEAGFRGIVKKVFILILIIVVNKIDLVLNTNGFFRNATIIGFMVNEILSLIENVGLMGIKIPTALNEAIDVLTKKKRE